MRYGYGYGDYGMMGGSWLATLLTIAIWAILIIGIVLLIVWATRMARHGSGGHLAHGGPQYGHGGPGQEHRPPGDRVVPPHVNVVPPAGQPVPPSGQMRQPGQQQMHQQQPMGQQPMYQQQMHQPQPGSHTAGQQQMPGQRPQSHDDAVAIARRRLAAGEISRTEFDEIMNGLRSW